MERYSPDAVKITYRGTLITGFAEGTFVECERNEDAYNIQVGSLGDVTRTRNLNKTGRVTITLMQHAPINDFLNVFLAADDLVDTPPGALQVKDLSNGMRVHAAEAWVTKPPKVERAKEAGTIQYVFECADLEFTVGTP